MSKPLSTFLTESTETPFSVTQFPKTLARLKSGVDRWGDNRGNADRNVRMFEKLIDTLNEYANKPIPNPIFNDVIKYNLSAVVEVAVSKTPEVWSLVTIERDANGGRLPEWEYAVDMISPYPHTIPGKLKKMESARNKYRNDPKATAYFTYFIGMMQELMPLVNRFISIKNTEGRVFKRQPKPIEDRQAIYVAPLTKTETGKMVLDVLTEITNKLKGNYADHLFTDWVAEAERFNKMTGKEQYDAQMWRMGIPGWSKLFEAEKGEHGIRSTQRLVSNFKAILRKEANREADNTQQAFIFKNAKKLKAIIELKEVEMHKPQILKLGVGGRNGFYGEIKFTFADGSSFMVKNQIVVKVNQYRTVFNQFPTTFHDVVMPDGKPMSMPSLERMVRVFCNKPDAGYHV